MSGTLNLARGALLACAACLWAQQAVAQRDTRLLPGGNARAPITVDAEKLDYFDKEQKLVYTGAVVAKQGDATLKSTALTIFLAAAPGQAGQPAEGASAGIGGNSQVSRMEAAGPVTMVSKDQVGTGDRGVYDKSENKVYLYGNVSLTQGANVIKGQKDSRLVYDLDSGRAQVMGGVSSLFTPGSDDPTKKKTDVKPTAKPKG